MTRYWTGMLFCICYFTALWVPVHAQNLKRDYSYSVHHYKHPNKVSQEKRRLDSLPPLYLVEVMDSTQSTKRDVRWESSYKSMSGNKARIKKFKVSTSDSAMPYVATSPSVGFPQRFPSRRNVGTPSRARP